jgi:hypothetical protein
MILSLCLALGMTRRRLLSEMDSAELSAWFALFRLEPEPALRADLRAGQIASALCNAYRASGAPAARPEDFCMHWRNEPAQGVEEMAQRLRALGGGGH